MSRFKFVLLTLWPLLLAVGLLIPTAATAQSLFPTGSLVTVSSGATYIDVFNPANKALTQVPITVPSGNFLSNNFTFDSSGNLYVEFTGSSGPYNITKVTPSGAQATFASSFIGGSAPEAAMAADGAGNIYSTDGVGDIVKFSHTGVESVLASASSLGAGDTVIATDPNNRNYLYVSVNSNVYQLSTNYVDGGALPAPLYSGGSFGQFYPDANGDLFLLSNKNVDEIDTSGNLTVLATFNSKDKGVGITVDSSGNYFVSGSFAIYENPAGSPSKNTSPPFSQWLATTDRRRSLAYAPAPTGSNWTGAGADSAWSTVGNWNGPVPGVADHGATTNSTDVALFNQNISNAAVSIDAVRNVQSISFDTANASSMTIGAVGGNALLLTSGGAIAATSTVVTPQTINAPLVLEGGGSYTFASSGAAAATLNFGGPVTAGASSGIPTLFLLGTNTGANTISGALGDGTAGGRLGLTVQGANWVLSGTNTYTGPTAVSGGTLMVGNGTGGTLGATTISVTGGTFAVAAGATVGNVTLSASGTGTVAFVPGAATVSVGSSGPGSAGATLSLTSGGTFSMIDGSAGSAQLQQQTGFAGTALSLSDATLAFDVAGSAADQLTVGPGRASVHGTNRVNIAASGGALTAGAYTLVSAPAGGLAGNFQFGGGGTTQTVSSGGSQYTMRLSNSSKALTVTVASTQSIFPTGSLVAADSVFDSLDIYPAGGGTPSVVPLRFGGLQSQSQPAGGFLSKKTSAGVRNPRHARGRLLSRFSTRRTSEWEMSRKSVPLGKYWRIRPLVFSFVPR